ncbi:MAG: hypothetical protein A3J83_01010 [Elusimicrobia bacterium RIFOXYA2_FULL_40_6]|nr:MAG: hypothetical protein A3J83_01010 [Elusimicrobia bacterium RIFOXYA2_FULL_40_6]
MRVAIIHDWLTNPGGAEKCLEVLCELFPHADLYTLVYDEKRLNSKIISSMNIKPSFIQKLPFAKTQYRNYLPLFPVAIEQFDLRHYDLVLSFSHCAAKGVITSVGTCHICYCCTPMRYAWDMYQDYMEGMGPLKKGLVSFFMTYLRMWDANASGAGRVNYFFSISNYISQKIRKYYNRDSEVIYPGLDTNFFTPSPAAVEKKYSNYFLIVSRLVTQKRIGLAVEAFNRLGLPLVVIGTGPDIGKLKKSAASNISFLGWQPDEILREYYRDAKAFLLLNEEDFGITPLEAQSCGKPVIAYAKGGALETVINGVTGTFFSSQTPEVLMEKIRDFNPALFDSNIIRAHAIKFNIEDYKLRLWESIMSRYNEFQSTAEASEMSESPLT